MVLFLTFTWAGESCRNMYSQSVSRPNWILSLNKFTPRFPLTELVTYCYHAPTPYDAESGNRTWVTLVGGKSSHHCAIPAPLDKTQSLLNRVLSAFTYLFLYFFFNYLITYFYILIVYSFSTLLSSFLCSFASAFFFLSFSLFSLSLSFFHSLFLSSLSSLCLPFLSNVWFCMAFILWQAVCAFLVNLPASHSVGKYI